jgi:hypothetical protein
MPPQANQKGNTAVAERRPAALAAIVPGSVSELLALAEIYFKAGNTPKGCNRPEAVAAVIAAGLEIGLKPAAALNSMYLVNGKIALYGDAPLGLVRASGLLDFIDEKVEGAGMERAGVCTMQRKGDPVGKRTFRFSAADAKQAGLWGKAGPWTTTPDRMLQLRARGWLLRDMFGDVLMGMAVAEDLEDAAAPVRAEVRTATVDTPPPPAQQAAAAEPPTDVHGEVMIDDAQLAEVKRLAPIWMRLNAAQGAPNTELAEVWRRMLAERFKVEMAAKLTSSQADELLKTLREAAANPTAALFAPTQANGAGQAAQQQQQSAPATSAA